MILRSVKFRLSAWSVLISLVVVGTLCGIWFHHINKAMFRITDRFLRDEAMEFAGLFGEDATIPSRLNEKVRSQYLDNSKNPTLVQIRDKDGNIMARSASLHGSSIPLSRLAAKDVRHGDFLCETVRLKIAPRRERAYRVVTWPVMRGGALAEIVQLGMTLKYPEKMREVWLETTLVALPVMVLVGLVGGYLIAHKALKPVHAMSKTARRITSHDMTQRLEVPNTGDEVAQLSETMNDMIERLDQAFGELQRFAADASHELKTPLATMRGEIEVALNRSRSPEEYQALHAGLLEQIDHLAILINDLLLLSRGEGTKSLELKQLDLNAVLQDVCEYGEVLSKESNIALEKNIQSIPSLTGNYRMLSRLFMNLIDNAIKFTPAGGRVIVTARTENNYARIDISDTGIGVAPEDLPRIFDRFYMADRSRSGDRDGTGLGLSIVRWIAEAHEGRVEAQSELGKGSTFTVLLPLL